MDTQNQVLIDIKITGELQNKIQLLDKLKQELASINKEQLFYKEAGMQANEAYKKNLLAVENYKTEISKLSIEVKNEIKLAKANKTSMNELSQSLTMLKNEYKNLSDTQRKSDYGKQLLLSINQQDTAIKAASASIGEHQRNVGNYPGLMGRVQESFSSAGGGIKGFTAGISTAGAGLNAMFGGFFAVTGAIKVFNSLLGSSEKLADAWEKTIAGAKAGYEKFMNSIATGDFSNFFKNIQKAIEAGEKYAEYLDYVEERNSSLNIKKADNDLLVADLRLKATQKDKYNAEQRLGFNQLAYNKSLALATDERNAAKRDYEEKIKFIYSAYNIQKATIENYLQYRDQYLEGAQDLIKTENELRTARKGNVLIDPETGRSQTVFDKGLISQLEAKIKSYNGVYKLFANQVRQFETIPETERKSLETLRELLPKAETELKQSSKRLFSQMQSQKDEIMNENKKYVSEKSKLNQKEVDETAKYWQDLFKLSEEYNQQIIDDKLKQQEQIAEVEKINEQNRKQQYADSIQALKLDEESKIIFADREIKNRKEFEKEKVRIQLESLVTQLKLTKEYLSKDSALGEEEKANIIKGAENAIGILKNQILTVKNADTEKEGWLQKALGLTEEDQKKIKEATDYIKTTLDGLQNYRNIQISNEQKVLDYQYERNKARIEESGKSQQEKAKELAALDKKFRKEKYELDLKQWKTDRAFALTKVIIAGLVAAVLQDWTAVVSAGLAVTGILAEKAPKPPAYKKGGLPPIKEASGTLIKVNENGQQEAIMTAGALKMFPRQLNAMNIAGGGDPLFGGYSANASAQGIMTDYQMINAFETAIAKMPEPVLGFKEFNQAKDKFTRIAERAKA